MGEVRGLVTQKGGGHFRFSSHLTHQPCKSNWIIGIKRVLLVTTKTKPLRNQAFDDAWLWSPWSQLAILLLRFSFPSICPYVYLPPFFTLWLYILPGNKTPFPLCQHLANEGEGGRGGEEHYWASRWIFTHN